MDSNAVPYGTAFFRFVIWKKIIIELLTFIRCNSVKNLKESPLQIQKVTVYLK